MSDTLVRVKGVDKRFGSVAALSGAAIDLERGRIRAIVGENGAGKSTLAKIIAGILPRDAGEFVLDGAAVGPWSRRQAIAAGIGFVPQALSFVATLSIVDNHLLAGGGLKLDRDGALSQLQKVAADMDVSLDMTSPVERLSLAGRQLGEIVSAVAAGARILLLDEPTSALGPVEIERLIRTIRRLASGGTSVALVTHRIAEVMEGADDITVLRGGKVILDGATAGLDANEVARLMVGDRDRGRATRLAATSDWQRLKVSSLTLRDKDQLVLDDISLAVRQGEILAIAGVAGVSQPALAEALAGLRGMDSGRVDVDGADVTGDPARSTRLGLAFIPENRADGIVSDLTISENASLFEMRGKAFRRFLGTRDRSAEHDHGKRIIADFDVRPPDPEAISGGLSGGNQQKLLVGRELARAPGVIVAHGPTQGLDLAAAASIRAALTKAAADGAAVVVISADLDELLELGHRMIVLTNGRVVAEFDLARPVDMTLLGQAMMGLNTMETAQ
ncbi:ATP-binding cassette domain-containing protein [Mesorhizobium australicum]|uniref:Simple sugar transport system ATP-binding protein n=1 Tax=Mesorhizobium australicum TaxID=536018 RepID=A0A1X7PRY8_9HYPH|nr:ATP-binding cassette domain-containing protein [Mesorhizobium australicum]SMH53912.1 simple sugar transport system ATP-binding protein [Mesorhizobium australicum]